MIKTRVCIIGAGTGGIGCAYRLIRRGVDTVIIDKNPDYGGTMTFGGIDGWEPGVSLDGIHLLIKDELEKIPFGAHVVDTVPNLALLDPDALTKPETHSFAERPWGYNHPMGGTYADTLARCERLRGGKPARRYQFDKDAFITALRSIFEPYSARLTELFGYSFISCDFEGDRIKAVTVRRGKDELRIEAEVFVDASGDIVLARAAGCEYAFGTEGKDEFDEPSACGPSESVNAVTYAFRVTKTPDPCYVNRLPEEISELDLEEWERDRMRRTVSLIVRYPNGNLHVNMLPTMEGAEYFSLGERADAIGRARVQKYWHYLQTEKGLSGYTLKEISAAGVRESYRLRGRYVLSERDLRHGAPIGADLSGRTVAIADHHMDVHGEGGLSSAMEKPYEIPIECTMTKEFDNLFVACRGASFTHIAASSARLSRTILSLGEGVGDYIADTLRYTGEPN